MSFPQPPTVPLEPDKKLLMKHALRIVG